VELPTGRNQIPILRGEMFCIEMCKNGEAIFKDSLCRKKAEGDDECCIACSQLRERLVQADPSLFKGTPQGRSSGHNHAERRKTAEGLLLQLAERFSLKTDHLLIYSLLEDLVVRLLMEQEGANPTSMRYSSLTKRFYSLIFAESPRSARLVALNLNGPSENTISTAYKKERGRFPPGFCKENFMNAAEVLRELARYHGIEGDIVVHVAGDESRVQEKLSPDFEEHVVVGSCGVAGHDACDFSQNSMKFEDVNDLTRIFEKHKAATHIRYLCLVPSDPRLPAVPLVILSTCLRFDSREMERQWKEVLRFSVLCGFGKGDQKIIFEGFASDGDSSRRNLMMRYMFANKTAHVPVREDRDGEPVEIVYSPFKLNHDTFLLHSYKRPSDEQDGQLFAYLSGQDQKHIVKRLMNNMDQVRSMYIGNYHVSLDILARATFATESGENLNVDTGLARSFFTGRDHQSVPQTYTLFSPKVEKFLETETKRKPELRGLLVYVKVASAFIRSYEGPVTTREVVELSSFVYHFFSSWRQYLHLNKVKHASKNGSFSHNVSSNFITYQTFADI